MRIVVLVKPVPDPASAGERLGADGRLDRAAVPAVVNGNDEYVLEAALKLVEAAGEGEITLLAMAPVNAPETLRKALAMGAHRGVHVTDPALGGSCAVSTAQVLAAALARARVRHGLRRHRLVGRGRWRRPGGGRRASRACRTCRMPPGSSPTWRREPYASDGSARPATTSSKRHCPWSSVARRRSASRATRRSRGSWPPAARRSSRARWPTSGSMQASVGGAVATTAVLGSTMPPARSATEVVRGSPDEGAARIVDFLAERRII